MNTNAAPSRPATQAIADMRIEMALLKAAVAKLG